MYGKSNRTRKYGRGGNLGYIYNKTYDERENVYEWVGECFGNDRNELQKQLGVRLWLGRVLHGNYSEL